MMTTTMESSLATDISKQHPYLLPVEEIVQSALKYLSDNEKLPPSTIIQKYSKDTQYEVQPIDTV